MLELDGVVAGYARSSVLHGVSLKVPDRSVVGLLGPNGAGKTTVAKTISALLRCRAGSIRFNGADIQGVKPEEIVRRGVTHVPQGRMLFPELTVQENLEMGAYLSPSRAETARNLGLVHDLFPILRERRGQLAGFMSGGEQQMLAVGRAMMVRPAVLLLDEPSIGLAPRMVDEIFRIVERIRGEGTSVLLIEQNARRTLAAVDYCYVLEDGRIVMEGTGEELARNDAVCRSYLGMT